MNDGLAAGELREELDRLWFVLSRMDAASEHRTAAQRFREEAEEIDRQTDLIRFELQTNIKQVNEESTKYLNAVAVVGYAGYFATWSFTKDFLTKDLALFVGLMGMISLSLFVLWEIWISFAVRLKDVGEMSSILRDLIDYREFEGLRREFQKNSAKRVAAYNVVHRIVFAASSMTACAGGLAMMQALYSTM